MKNVDVKIDTKGIMTIKVDTNEDFGLSKSGKTQIIATTAGNHETEDGVFIGLNVYRYATAKK